MIAARVKDVNGATQQSMQYRYNDKGIRVASTVNGVETRYLIDEVQSYAQVLEEYSSSGEVQVSYVYGNRLISEKQGGARTFYHVDGLGSTRVLTDAQGQVVSTYNYEAYGELINSTGGVENKYLFAGEQYDPALGDYYLRARYYDPETGRFTRRDIYEGGIENPVSLHKYLYANANPVLFIDPSGLVSIGEISAAEKIREIISSFYSEFANQALSLAESGGNPQVYATRLAWDLGIQSVPFVYNRIRKIANQSFASNQVRAKAYREALGLKPVGSRNAGNFAFADIKIVGDERLTLLARSGDNLDTRLVGIPDTGRIHFSTFEVPPGFRRDTDTEFKILEAVASRYENNRDVKGVIYLYTERSPCGSCQGVIKQFETMFSNIKINIRDGKV